MFVLVKSSNGKSVRKPSLVAAVADGDVAGRTIVVTEPITTNNVIIPATIALEVEKGGLITVNGGNTLTINGSFSANRYQVFAGAGSVVFGSDVADPNGWFAAGQSVTFNAGISAPPSLISTAMVLGNNARFSAVHPEWFKDNATPGTTDMTSAINAAINCVGTIGGGKVVSNMPHLITSPIMMKSGVHLEINNTLTCSGMNAYGADGTDHSAVFFKGTSVLTSALTVSGVSGDLTVTVANSSGIVIGDSVIVEDSYNFGRGNIDGVNSHLARVMNVVGNVLTLNNALQFAFASATSQVRKVTLLEDATVAVKLITGAPYQGVTFMWARHCTVKDTEVNRVGKDVVYFHTSFGCLATNIIGRNPVSVVSPFGYGALFDFGASDNILENSYFEGTREVSAAEYAKRNIIRNNRLINSADSAINTHGLSAMDTLIEGNYIVNPTQYGIAIGQLATAGRGVDIRTVVRGNTIINSTGWAIREVQFSPGTSVASDTIIENNVIKSGATDAIYIGGSNSATDYTNTTIRNNKITGAGGNGIMIDTLSANNVTVQNNIIDNSTATGILLNAPGNNIVVQDNVITSTGQYGIRNYAVGPRILISGNTVNSSGTADYLNVGLAMPTAGTWRIGDRMPYYGNGATPLNGWRRITTGAGNVLNTDWVAN